MMTIAPTDATVTLNGAQKTLTDGYHLVVDGLKLNGVETIYGVVGIPITDLARVAQASPMDLKVSVCLSDDRVA